MVERLADILDRLVNGDYDPTDWSLDYTLLRDFLERVDQYRDEVETHLTHLEEVDYKYDER